MFHLCGDFRCGRVAARGGGAADSGAYGGVMGWIWILRGGASMGMQPRVKSLRSSYTGLSPQMKSGAGFWGRNLRSERTDRFSILSGGRGSDSQWRHPRGFMFVWALTGSTLFLYEKRGFFGAVGACACGVCLLL